MQPKETPEILDLKTATKLLHLNQQGQLLFEMNKKKRFAKPLTPGMHGEEIIWLEKALIITGYLPYGTFHGRYDQRIQNAIEKLQREYLEPPYQKGHFDTPTRRKMNEFLNAHLATFNAEIAQKLHSVSQREISAARRGSAIQIVRSGSGIAIAAALTMSALVAGIAIKHEFDKEEAVAAAQAEAERDLSPSQQRKKVLSRRIDNLEIPSDMPNMGILFYTANPIIEPQTGLFYDTLIDRDTIAKQFFQEKFFLMGVDEEDTLPRQDQALKRIYRFTVPGKEVGILVQGSSKDMTERVTWADALGMLTQAQGMKDADIIKYLQWWYKRTYWLDLDASRFTIQRDSTQRITNVLYNDTENTMIGFDKRKVISDGRYTTETIAKPLTDNGRLLLWTGVNQELAIPENLLTGGFTINHSIDRGVSFQYTTDELAMSFKRYFAARDVPDDKRMIYYTNLEDESSARENFGRFVTDDDPIIKRLVATITAGAKTRYEALDRLRRFAQTLRYRSETQGVEVNRPAIATLLQGWGDCNNLSVFLATLIQTDGFKTAFVYMERTPEQKAAIKKAIREHRSDGGGLFSRHVAPAVRKEDLAGYRNRYTSWGNGWVIVEATGKSDFGEEDYKDDSWQLTPVIIKEN